MSLPTHITRHDMATLLGVTPQRVGQLADLGVLSRSGREYCLEGAVNAYADFLITSRAKSRANPALTALQERQIEQLDRRIAREEAELITLDEAVSAGAAITDALALAIEGVPDHLPPGDKLFARAKSLSNQASREFREKATARIEDLKRGRKSASYAA